jgi:hypothetical protein
MERDSQSPDGPDRREDTGPTESPEPTGDDGSVSPFETHPLDQLEEGDAEGSYFDD